MITDQKTFDQYIKSYLTALAHFNMIFTFQWHTEKNDDSVELRISDR